MVISFTWWNRRVGNNLYYCLWIESYSKLWHYRKKHEIKIHIQSINNIYCLIGFLLCFATSEQYFCINISLYHTSRYTTLPLKVCIGRSLIRVATPPWLLFSLRGWRKRCQHDPGSRLWRGSGGKSKTLSPSHRLALTCGSHRFLLLVSCQDISHVQRHLERGMHTDDSSLRASIVWVEEAKMTGCLCA